jgi:hypothetical protein
VTLADDELLDRLYKAAEQSELILVGGHATAVWADAYGLTPIRSDDLDWQCSPKEADEYAARLGASLLRNAAFEGHHSLLRMAREDADEPLIVDFLTGVLGVPHAELRERAVPIVARGASVKAMHPVHLVMSRCTNLAHPGRRHRRAADLAQAKVAIGACGAFLRQMAEEDRKMTKRAAKRLLEFCRKIEARTCWQEHRVDPFNAVSPWEPMDPDFRSRTYQRWRTEADRLLRRVR